MHSPKKLKLRESSKSSKKKAKHTKRNSLVKLKLPPSTSPSKPLRIERKSSDRNLLSIGKISKFSSLKATPTSSCSISRNPSMGGLSDVEILHALEKNSKLPSSKSNGFMKKLRLKPKSSVTNHFLHLAESESTKESELISSPADLRFYHSRKSVDLRIPSLSDLLI